MPVLAYLHKFIVFSFLSLVFFLVFHVFLSGDADLVIFCLGDGANDAAGDAVSHVACRDTHTAFYHCPCADETVFFDDSSLLNDGTHADENIIMDGTAMDDGVVADSHAAANVDVIAYFHMEGGIFLQVGVVADLDFAIACANDRAGIDDDIFPQLHTADDFRCGKDEAGIGNFWDEVFIFADHEIAPFLKKSLIYIGNSSVLIISVKENLDKRGRIVYNATCNLFANAKRLLLEEL